MPSPRFTFRAPVHEHEQREAFAAEMFCSATEVARYGQVALARAPGFRREVAAANAAGAFIADLRQRHGASAMLHLDLGSEEPQLKVKRRDSRSILPVKAAEAEAVIRRLTGKVAIDLIDPKRRVAIRNAYVATTEAHIIWPLEGLWVVHPAPLDEQRQVVSLPDGSTIFVVATEVGTRSYKAAPGEEPALFRDDARAEWAADQ